MGKKTAMEQVVMVAGVKESSAAKSLADVVGEHTKVQAQYDQIQQYRTEYRNHFEQISQAGMDGRQMAEYRRFLTGLDDAIEQQRGRVVASEKRVDQSRSDWTAEYQRKKSLDQFVASQKQIHQAQVDKAEQKAVDEMVGQSSSQAT